MMKSKTNAILAAVRDEEQRVAERMRSLGAWGSPAHAPDELAQMVRELAALLLDAAPTSWARQDAATESLRILNIGEAISYPKRFEPLRYSMTPDVSLVCFWACEDGTIQWQDDSSAYHIARPEYEHAGIVRELLFALKVLARLAWLRVDVSESAVTS